MENTTNQLPALSSHQGTTSDRRPPLRQTGPPPGAPPARGRRERGFQDGRRGPAARPARPRRDPCDDKPLHGPRSPAGQHPVSRRSSPAAPGPSPVAPPPGPPPPAPHLDSQPGPQPPRTRFRKPHDYVAAGRKSRLHGRGGNARHVGTGPSRRAGGAPARPTLGLGASEGTRGSDLLQPPSSLSVLFLCELSPGFC
ncbi:basic proline-rich protein-like [Dama dama]|uniref:basic proline-rich protein-like n=1 Tax=Dama dama TaxID=30532 RepID=UPI002A36B17A|nr:basic proline-rich protein-like [Dama dama]